MVQRKLRQVAVAAATVTTMAGGGLVLMGATPALAGTSTTTYSCVVAGQTQAGALTITAPDTGSTSSTVQVNISQPAGGSSPVAISGITVSGTATVAGDGATTTLPFSGSIGAVAANTPFPAISTNVPLTLPASNATVTVTLPTTYSLSVNAGSFGILSGTCTATTPTSVSITVASQPTVTVSSVSGQTGTGNARPGSTVNFTGTGFAAGATVSASLVPTAGGTAIPLTTTPATITATGGAISGSAAIPGSVAAGAYALTFSDTSGDLPATAPLTILAAPSCAASPASGGAGTVTTVTCSSFDPGAAVTVQGVTSGGTATSDAAVSATANSTGAVSASYTVNATTTAGIKVTESSPESESATAPFAASANNCIADANGATGGSCSIAQGATTTVNPGPLAMQQGGSQITLSNITLNGAPQTVTGSMNPVVVADFRGGTLGWTLNATATNFSGPHGGSIPASSLTVTPGCAPDPNGLALGGVSSFPSTVSAGPVATMGSAVTLCSTPALGAGHVTGGIFDVTGNLSLALPAYLLADTYLNTITFSLG